MSTDLISKKDLLELTGISYGQLYRWKKKKFNTGRLVCTKVYIHGSGNIFSERKDIRAY
ncbi:DUF4004 family protein [Bacillus pacificus]